MSNACAIDILSISYAFFFIRIVHKQQSKVENPSILQHIQVIRGLRDAKG
jgi:hypothetical protein